MAHHPPARDQALSPEPTETIAAIATPPGFGGIGVVRASGPAVREIARAVLGRLPRPRLATLAAFVDALGRPIDRGIALFFPAPRSFTGEDVLELHGHGGPVVLDLVLARLLELGARAARPGEFSERAFLNGKIDLAQAEAVADLIAASSAAAARSAMRSLDGAFSARIREAAASLTDLRVYVEAAIDFPEEEVDFLGERRLGEALGAIEARLSALADSAEQGRLLREGMTVVLAGRPNAGKSSLLNRLLERDAAIVSSTPGTTRDPLRHELQIDGMPVHVVDTAGLRPPSDAIEEEGVRRARAAIADADHALVLIDDTRARGDETGLVAELPRGVPYTVVRNKIDLTGRRSGLAKTDTGTEIAVSAKTGAGIPALRQYLKDCMGFRPAGEGGFIARRRHLDAIARARAHVAAARRELEVRKAGELVAEELRLAQRALGEITGEVTPEDLLERIFSKFCIGK